MPEIIIVPALFVTIGFIVWTIASNWQRNRHLREMTAFHARIIDRMGSIKDFNDFLQTPGGLQFMNALTADKGPTGPRERILRAVQTGIVLSSVGGGCLALSDMFQDEASDLFTVAGRHPPLARASGSFWPQAPHTASASAWACSSQQTSESIRPSLHGEVEHRGCLRSPSRPSASWAKPNRPRPWMSRRFTPAIGARRDRCAHMWRGCMGSVSHADDIVQEAYLRLLRIERPSDDPAVQRALLIRIASNLMVDHWRRTRRELAESAAPAEPGADGPDLALRLDMARVFGALRPEQRQLVWLAYVERASHKEISAAIGVRERSVRVLLHRAKRKLAEILGEAGFGNARG